MSKEVALNARNSRYEQIVDGYVVYADVRNQAGVIYIDYVYAPPELRGTGAAGKFMDAMMKIIRADGLKAVPICGYAAGWLRRHSEYHDLLVD